MAWVKRLQAWDEALWKPVLEGALAIAGASSSECDARVAQLRNALLYGGLALYGVGEGEAPTALAAAWGTARVVTPASVPQALVGITRDGPQVNVKFAQGVWDEQMAAATLPILSDGAELLLWADETLPNWTTWLAPHGVRAFTQQELVLDLPGSARLFAAGVFPATDDPAVRLYQPGDANDVIDLLARLLADSIEGMQLTMPLAPTAENLRQAVAAFLSPGGQFQPHLSFVFELEGQLEGVELTGWEDGVPIIWEICLSAATRGRGAAAALLIAMRRNLIAHDIPLMRFASTAGNTAVHRLYRPEEVHVAATYPCGVWWRR